MSSAYWMQRPGQAERPTARARALPAAASEESKMTHTGKAVTGGETGSRERVAFCGMGGAPSSKGGCFAAAALVLALCVLRVGPAFSQTYSAIVLTPPIVDRVDGNHVSMITGKTQFTIPALTMGDVSFAPYALNGSYLEVGQVLDHNYGRIASCTAYGAASDNFSGTSECISASQGIQAIYGEERGTFSYSNGQYLPDADDGAKFVDSGNTCTWTQRDGTKIVYASYHVSGDPRCFSNNILEVAHTDGRIATYYYYGAFSTTYGTQTPIISIATNSGYLLKYNYTGTPSVGGEASVTAINRAFQTCDPSAVSCAITQAWPTATLSYATKELTSNCDDFSTAAGYDPCRHYIVTIQDEAHRDYVFETDSYFRVVSYQPPGATQPAYYYNLCSLLANDTLRHCWGWTTWPPDPNVATANLIEPLLFDWVESATHNGQTWNYNYDIQPNAPPAPSTWEHSVTTPLGTVMSATGNSTPGLESYFGPIDSITLYDGTIDHFERNTQNLIYTQTTPAGVVTTYGYDLRGGLTGITRIPVAGKGQSAISESAAYSYTCTTSATCNAASFCPNMGLCDKPISTTDFNRNTANFTYDPNNGAVWTETDPSVNGVRPQTRYFYTQMNAWYLSSTGVMTKDPNPIWVLTGKSYCMTGAAEPSNSDGSPAALGAGCTRANDEVMTTYDYGPAFGPNNLLVRGEAVTSEGQTLRTCYGHDAEGNKIWQTSANANPSGCPSY